MTSKSHCCRPLRILAIEPYSALSHMQFLEGLKAHSRHRWAIETLPARKWKWRMRSAALHFAQLAPRYSDCDLIFASDYLNVPEFQGLTRESLGPVPMVLYFHENQLTYPLREGVRRDYHFAFNHLFSILCSQRSFFNSRFHLDSFQEALETFLGGSLDMDVTPYIPRLREKCSVLPLGTDIARGHPRQCDSGEEPILLWNHRWEYDKNPEGLIEGIQYLLDRKVPFRLKLLGQSFQRVPEAFDKLIRMIPDKIDHSGFVEDRDTYLQQVASCHIIMSTAVHEFFGLSALEGIRQGLYPVLPDALAYPELLSPSMNEKTPFLYPLDQGIGPALERAIQVVMKGEMLPLRERMIEQTDRFEWRRLAPVYDRVLEGAARG